MWRSTGKDRGLKQPQKKALCLENWHSSKHGRSQLPEVDSLLSENQFLADYRGYSLWFPSIRQQRGMVNPLSGGWQLHKENRCDLTGYFQETKSLKWEAGMPEWLWGKFLLLNWINQGLFWQKAASLHRLQTVLFVMWQSYQSKVILWILKYLARVMFDLCNSSCLYLFWQEPFVLLCQFVLLF